MERAEVVPFKRFKALSRDYSPATQLAIEKIDTRIHKDVRAEGATFGILQQMDSATKERGRLRNLAENQLQRGYFEAKKLKQRGQSDIFPGISAMAQRDVRQMRSHKPGVVPKAEGFK